jgi:hypothetical protein
MIAHLRSVLSKFFFAFFAASFAIFAVKGFTL